VPSAATVGATGYYALQGMSFGTQCCNILWAAHLETWTKESGMRVSRQVLKPGMHKKADERQFLTGRTTSGP
jgi:hypothetical protein